MISKQVTVTATKCSQTTLFGLLFAVLNDPIRDNESKGHGRLPSETTNLCPQQKWLCFGSKPTLVRRAKCLIHSSDSLLLNQFTEKIHSLNCSVNL